jgi:sulfofructose kinase
LEDIMPKVLIAGTAVQDLIYRFDSFPKRGTKSRAREFVAVGGGMAANAAVAVARLGGDSHLIVPLGDDGIADMILSDLRRDGVNVDKVLRSHDFQSPMNAAIIDETGERTILTWRRPVVSHPTVEDPMATLEGFDAFQADDRHPSLVIPLLEAARAKGIPGVLDADRAEGETGSICHVPTHIIFSRAGLAGTAGVSDPVAGLYALRKRTDAFLAVTLGGDGLLWLNGGDVQTLPAFHVDAVDTLGAGDIFHGAFTLALAEKQSTRDALRFASAVSALKCLKFGGRAAIPSRAEVEEFLKTH